MSKPDQPQTTAAHAVLQEQTQMTQTTRKLLLHWRRIWRDRVCDMFGHQWQQRGENRTAFECRRCFRHQLMLQDRRTGELKWIITP